VTAGKKLLFKLFTVIGVLVLLEIGLQIGARLSSSVDAVVSVRPRAPEGRARWMPSPKHPEHDAKGFRNPRVPESVPIVALGDSNTYGWGVKPEEAWPRRLERLAEQDVYSLAWGGFGPVHLLSLFDEALALKPRLIIVSFYSGNDLYDSYDFVYKEGQLAELLKSGDATLVGELARLENDSANQQRLARLQAATGDFHMLMRGKRRAATTHRAQKRSMIRAYVLDHLKLWGVLRAARRVWTQQRSGRTVPRDYLNHEPAWPVIREQARKNPEFYWIFDNGRLRTVFAVAQRLYGTNLDDPRIAEGQRIAMETLRRMDERARAAGARFLVMLWPTKELAFKELASHARDVPDEYLRLVATEELIWRQTREFLGRHGIEHFDVLPAIRQSLQAGVQVYSTSPDSHMNSQGQRVISEAALAQIRTIKF
jgi:GDSL-like lipase/acylhydrolase family protein